MNAAKTLRLHFLLAPLLSGLALAIFSLLLMAGKAQAVTRDVCSEGCTYTTIQAAVQAAADGDTIRVVEGTYTGRMTTLYISPGEEVSSTITATVILTKNITLLGGYNSELNEYNPQQNITTIDGQQAGWPVVVILASQAKIDGFHLINGLSPAGSGVWVGDQPGKITRATISHNFIANNRVLPGSSGEPGGAGVLVQGAVEVTLSQNQILSNTLEGAGYGAGVSVRDGANVLVEGNTIAYNRALASGSSGSGIYVASSNVRMIGNAIQENQNGGIEIHNSLTSSITSNTISKNQAPQGAGIWISGSTVYTITGNVVSDNHSYSLGGAGLLIQGGHGTIAENSLLNNQAAQGGGGLSVSTSDGTVELRKNQILLNSAGYGGGVLVSSLSGAGTSLLLAGNDIRNNMTTNATSQAGGVQIETLSDLPVILVNNVIAGNQGRGVKGVDSGAVTLLNNTIVNNGLVGAEFSSPSQPRTVFISSNIFAGHSSCAVNGLDGAVLEIKYSLFWNNYSNGCGSWSGERNKQGIPKFVNPSLGDYHISIGSAALNAGSPSSAAAYDKDGLARPQGFQFDAGAYEIAVFQAVLPLIRH